MIISELNELRAIYENEFKGAPFLSRSSHGQKKVWLRADPSLAEAHFRLAFFLTESKPSNGVGSDLQLTLYLYSAHTTSRLSTTIQSLSEIFAAVSAKVFTSMAEVMKVNRKSPNFSKESTLGGN